MGSSPGNQKTHHWSLMCCGCDQRETSELIFNHHVEQQNAGDNNILRLSRTPQDQGKLFKKRVGKVNVNEVSVLFMKQHWIVLRNSLLKRIWAIICEGCPDVYGCSKEPNKGIQCLTST